MNLGSTSVAFAAAVALTLPTRPLRAAEPPAADIRVAKSVEEQDNVRAWAERAAKDGLAAAKVDVASSERRLVIDIGGVMFAFDVVVGVQADGEWVGEKRARHCECGAQELVDRVREDVTAVAPLLRASASVSAPPVAATAVAPPSAPVETDRPPARGSKKLQPMGAAGAGMLGIGGAATIAGVALVIVGKKDQSSRPSDDEEINYRTPGIGVLCVGLAVAVTGATLLGVERSRARRSSKTSWAPSFDGRAAMIVWGGKF